MKCEQPNMGVRCRQAKLSMGRERVPFGVSYKKPTKYHSGKTMLLESSIGWMG